MTLTSRSRRFVLWMALLALTVYVVQIVAIDHWHADPANTAGIPDSNSHAVHCHGTPSCADGAALTPGVLATALTPLPPEPRLYGMVHAATAAENAFVDTPVEPPRAA